MKAAEFVGMLFLARDVAHSAHLNTRSYARHKALQEFYESVPGLADAFAEAWQGRHGLLGPIALPANTARQNIIDFLAGQLAAIESGRDKMVPANDTALRQLIDNVVELYLTTLYKLRFLA